MPKRPDACWTCKHDIYNDGCRHIRCKDCKLYVDNHSSESFCKCTTIQDGEECPYYEED